MSADPTLDVLLKAPFGFWHNFITSLPLHSRHNGAPLPVLVATSSLTSEEKINLLTFLHDLGYNLFEFATFSVDTICSCSAVHHAAFTNDVPVLALLCDILSANSLSVDLIPPSHDPCLAMTPLAAACVGNAAGAVSELCKRGANPSFMHINSNYKMRYPSSFSFDLFPLHAAVNHASLEAIQAMFSSMNAVSAYDCMSIFVANRLPLALAMRNGRADVACLLLRCARQLLGADRTASLLNRLDSNGANSAFLAAQCSLPTVLRLIVLYGGIVDRGSKFLPQSPPRHVFPVVVSEAETEKGIRDMIEHGVFSIRSIPEMTLGAKNMALLAAVSAEKWSLVRAALQAGAQADARVGDETPGEVAEARGEGARWRQILAEEGVQLQQQEQDVQVQESEELSNLVEQEAEQEAEHESEPEAEQEAEPEADAEADAEPEQEQEPEPEPVAAQEPEAELKPEPEQESKPEAEPASKSEAEPAAAPQAEVTEPNTATPSVLPPDTPSQHRRRRVRVRRPSKKAKKTKSEHKAKKTKRGVNK